MRSCVDLFSESQILRLIVDSLRSHLHRCEAANQYHKSTTAFPSIELNYYDAMRPSVKPDASSQGFDHGWDEDFKC